MILIPELESYIESVRNRVEAINFHRVLVDNDDIGKDLQQRSAAVDKIMLYAGIPEQKVVGRDDMYQDRDMMGFMVLEKTDYSASSSHEKWLDVFARTQATANEVRNLMIADYESHQGYCGIMSFLEISSISIEPVKYFSSCNGWMILFQMKSDF